MKGHQDMNDQNYDPIAELPKEFKTLLNQIDARAENDEYGWLMETNTRFGDPISYLHLASDIASDIKNRSIDRSTLYELLRGGAEDFVQDRRVLIFFLALLERELTKKLHCQFHGKYRHKDEDMTDPDIKVQYE